MSDVIILDDSNFETEIKKHKIAVVDFWAEWCGPCKMFSTIFDEFASENKNVSCIKVNVDSSPITSNKYKIMSIPSILFFKDGEVVKQSVGFLPKAMLKKTLDEIM